MCIQKKKCIIILYIFKNKFKIIKTPILWNLVKFFIYHYYKTMDKNTQIFNRTHSYSCYSSVYLYARPLCKTLIHLFHS
jgi:hypothetical protein